MAKVILSKNAEKELAHLPKKQQKKAFRKLKALQSNPLLGKKLTGQLKGLWSCRAWPYRIIYELCPNKLIIHHLLHRQKAYK